ncbi:MAG: sugar ABC transporter substrate-binding protein [Candidatus Lumbricidophila eiseniae]|uniref:Sugar ABC transporter substrate-binding protein n=1 Tax=Candidatus Lumbricidiphila eiseniae TaxID=1969409 RepID=A0A2A6FQU6_9MICO|nr:MAG: sugar ABC transporter substrate-binding protein [Candidatus Lumbricidophila eiseniae]
MKQTLRIGAAAFSVVAALAFSGCASGPSSNAGSGSTSLNLLVPTYDDKTKGLWQDVITGFEAKNPTIKVNLEVQSWDAIDGVMKTKIQGNQAPDIFNGGPFASYATDDLIYKAEEIASPGTFADFQESFIKNEQLNGTTYALPLIASARALFVNNTLLKQAGVAAAPKTWDELLDAAKKITSLGNGIKGYGMPLGSEETQGEAAIWLWGGGGTFGNETTLKIDDPSNLVGAEQMKKMIDAGVTEENPGSMNRSTLTDVFIQGKIGMQVLLPPIVGQIKEKNPALDYSIVPIPTKDGAPLTLGVADRLMAFKNKGDKQSAITKFMDYFYQADVYTAWVKAEGFLPTTKSGSVALSSLPELKPFLDVLPSARFYPTTNAKWAAADAAFKSLFGKIQTDPAAQVLTSVQKQAMAG